MFIAVYEFEIKEGTDKEFRESWLEVTKAIYKYSGSFGSRLHKSDNPNLFVGYAQWPGRDQWEKDNQIIDDDYSSAQQRMRDCIVSMKTVYELEVCDDYLQNEQANS